MIWLDGEKQYANDQYATELEYLTPANIKEFRANLLGQMQFEIFVQGNMYKYDVLGLSDMVKSSFNPRPLP